MEKKTRDALAARFPEQMVKTRPGSFGAKQVQYIEASHIINRLTEVCDGNWSFTVVSHHKTDDGEIVVHGRLEALGVVKEAFGRACSVSRDGEVIRSIGDCYKAATTQSLTVAARLLGVAAYLYVDDLPEENSSQSNRHAGSACSANRVGSVSDPTRNRPIIAAKPLSSNSNNPPSSSERLTPKQLSAIWNLGRKADLDADQIRSMAEERFRNSPEFLSKADASLFITQLSERIDGKRGVA